MARSFSLFLLTGSLFLLISCSQPSLNTVAGTWQLKTQTQQLSSQEITSFESVGSSGQGRCKTIGSIQISPTGSICNFYIEGTYALKQDSLSLHYGPCRITRSPSAELSKSLQAGIDEYNQTHREFLLLSRSNKALTLRNRQTQGLVSLKAY